MFKKLFVVSLISSFLMACGGNTATTSNSSLSASGGNAVNTTNTANTNMAPSISNTANVNKPAVDKSPNRIAFGKNQNWGTINLTLAPNATQQIVFNAKVGQMMEVESSSKDVAINLRKGKAQTTEDFGYLEGELQSSGDFVVDIKNSSKKEVKTSVKITIQDGNRKTDEGQGADDGDRPEPTGTNSNSDKEGN